MGILKSQKEFEIVDLMPITNTNLNCLDDSFLKEITEHNHQITDHSKISKLKKRNDMKRKCIEAVTESPLSIVTDIMYGDPSDIIICKGKEIRTKKQFHNGGSEI
ncbi:hypothetical protein A3Q56_04745 [Intoshia linei]|uniref:Uncharacterized protein n=1 Tax=Intoshia linei TaxID=1819745 RepID=A0A177AZV3_9BILA|nr:hypothetical protein A3Q56_04745 [Intoshia linei]